MQRLLGKVQHYHWGSTDVIPSWLGIEPTGQPHAEYWLGAHPSAPATVEGGLPLTEAIASDPDVLGQATRKRFGDQLPFLVKILSADKALSLQTHPPAELAAAGFAKEEAAGLPLGDPTRNYKDPNAKPELALALTPMDALVGFRDPAETVELFDALGVATSLESVIGPLRHRRGGAALAEVFLDALVRDDEHLEMTKQLVVAAVKHAADDGALGEFARTIVQLDAQFPGDPSLVGALLMNRIRLQPGQAIHLRPGVLHAYLGGTCIEVMGNSDNVLRGGLTSKHIDPGALVEVASFEFGSPEIISASSDERVARYDIDEEVFAVWRIAPSQEPIALPASGLPRVLVCWDGELQLTDAEDNTLRLARGQAAFLAAGEQVRGYGDGTQFLAAPGEPASSSEPAVASH